MLTYKEFEVIRILAKAKNKVSDISSYISKNKHYYIFKSPQKLNAIINNLIDNGYIANGAITTRALKEIEPLRVKNAIILAAGGADISAKSVYSMPKGLFMKNGETLIERQIRQLKEVGINDITVVISYKQELYFFLQDKWGVKLRVNPDLKKNNIYSLYIARDQLSSTYICNCDNYFEQNPFSPYEFSAYHASVYKTNAHNELLVKKNDAGRLLEIYSGVSSGECIYGHAYVDNKFSKKFTQYLEKEIDDFRISALFWEEFVSKHVNNLDMYIQEYPADSIFEFDKIQQIQNIDGLFLRSVSHLINKKICDVLKCNENDITDIVILQKGLTNILFTFVVFGERYIFRYPGDSSSFFIYRKNECLAQKLAAKAHADDTYIYIDEQGIKISKFRENTINLYGKYYHDIELMKSIAKKIKSFHDLGYNLPNHEEFNYDPIYQCERLFREASKTKGNLFQIFKDEWEMMRRLQKYADKDGIRHTMCHNDINIDNILLTDTTLDIIDWEFAGYNDPGYDFGRVIAGLDYEVDDPKVIEILEAYFGRSVTELEHLHWMAYAAIHNWYYVGWALYKESINESSRDWMLFFYQQAKKLARWCLPKYQKMYGDIEL
ncbi:phosphotransferase [Desulfovibrio piger]|uniref:phosphotransferase n=1 Tax=Desulfovibrio piger TaxID=901 RepID=UPI0039F62011